MLLLCHKLATPLPQESRPTYLLVLAVDERGSFSARPTLSELVQPKQLDTYTVHLNLAIWQSYSLG